jgi:hypothetical protein
MDYVSFKTMASFHIDTPDPALSNPPVGQRILISWHIRKGDFYGHPPYYIKLTMRYCNRKECVQWIQLYKSFGTYIYRLVDQAYFACSGIQTYKVELFHEGQMIECWKHQLWSELIILNNNQNIGPGDD